MTIQTKYSNWIDKNWQFKQDIQIELKKIANSKKKYLNWIEKNWEFKQDIQIELKKLKIQTKKSNWIEIF